jgi:hypothetical protein
VGDTQGPRLHRRDVLTVGAVGITSLVLPAAAAATSGASSPVAGQPQAEPPIVDPDFALSLNGTSTTASTSGTTRVITTAAFTLELWILYTGGNKGKYRNFVNQYASSTQRIYIGLNNTNDNRLKFAWGGSTERTVDLEQFSVPEDQWFHVAMTRTSGGSVALYVDGVLISSPSGTSTGIPNADFQVGGRGTAEYVPGQIDQVKVWDSALTEEQIRRSMHAYSDTDAAGTIAATLAAHYDFNEGEGRTVRNRVGTAGADLTVTDVVPAYSQDAIMTESVVGSDRVMTFKRTFLPSRGGWSVPPSVTAVRSLVVAGGGGGGSDEGGGGGAGGFIETAAQSVSGVEPVVVGQGGLGGYSISGVISRRPTSGQNSSFGSTSRVTAIGGGGGGDASDGTSSTGTTAEVRRGLDGGSGGGAAGEKVAAAGGKGTSLQGNDGASTVATQDAGGGGGGAGGAATTRAGGSGLESTITGASPAPLYAAGGSGGLGTSGSATQPGTDGIGGVGGGSSGSATLGVVNTGSGGGGGPFRGSARMGAGGGIGVVIVRYSVA